MILMFGDTHGEFRHVLPAVEAENPKAIIFLGDLQTQRPLEEELASVLDKTEVWWIPGNHDTDSRADYDNLYTSKLADRNLHGRVVEIDGIRVAGLGGIFREASWYPQVSLDTKPQYPDYDSLINAQMESERWKEYRRLKKAGQDPDGLPSPPMIGKALTHRSTIFWNTWMELHGQQADILVTHEAPTCHPHGFMAIDALALSMKVKLSFHGHHHDRLDYSAHYDRLGFTAYGVGLRGITDLNGKVIRPGQLDVKRRGRQGSSGD